MWSALTRPERLSEWFGATAVEVELNVGGRITFHRDEVAWRGLVEAVEPPRRFGFRWLAPAGVSDQRTRVEFSLEETGGGTRLTVREGPLWEGPAGQPKDLTVAGRIR